MRGWGNMNGVLGETRAYLLLASSTGMNSGIFVM